VLPARVGAAIHKINTAINTGMFLTSGPQWSMVNSGMKIAAVSV
jgi:hypothetical protein